MAISAQVRQSQYMLMGWLRLARRRYVALLAIIFGSILLASLVVSDSLESSNSRTPYCRPYNNPMAASDSWQLPFIQLTSSQSRDSTQARWKDPWLGHKRSTIKPGFLHLLVPGNTPDINLCKTILTAALAGFPTPTIINWGKVFNDENLTVGGAHIAKISGITGFLQKMDSSHDEDLVLVVDGHDIWFQLGPQVLVDRFHELCREADARLEARLGRRAMQELGIRDRIFFGAQKECWPGSDDDMNCYASPNSTLPEDIYGPDTDTLIDDERNPSLRFRQRYMNSGTVMGTLKEMRRFYELAMERFRENANFGSDQSIFARIFGEQQYQREIIRLRYQTRWQKWKSLYEQHLYGNRQASILDPHPTRNKMEPAAGAPYEYNVGLDYTSSLGQSTVFAEYDGEWIVFNDTATIVQAYEALNISSPGAYEINEDVASSLPPFYTLSRLNIDLPSERTWQDVKLYTNLYTGITPVMIHHNAHRDNLKTQREVVWDRMWFHPYVRQLLNARTHEPYLPIAVTGEKGQEKAWWGSTEKQMYGLGAQPDYAASDWLHWDDLTDEGWSHEIFRDDAGAWKDL